MPTVYLDVARMHRVERIKRLEASNDAWLEQRRREIAERSCVDFVALRAKLAI